jgi:GTPase
LDLPVVAVVGRPNVGKSTLANRLIGRREAITESKPGVTRDRVIYSAEWRGRPFLVVDTGGLESDPTDALAGRVVDVAKAAASEADKILLVVDAAQGITAEDESVAEVVRKLGPPIVLVANKVDTAKVERDLPDLFSLGMGQPIPVSALHGRGAGDLLDLVVEGFPDSGAEGQPEAAVAIVGKPNVGKSTLFNVLAGGERSIVHSEPGTTRDAVDTLIDFGGKTYRFIDTAGLRRAARVDEATELYGTVRTTRALERCDVALLVVDATEGVSRQDLRIAEQISEAGRSAVVVLNKIDAVDGEEMPRVRSELGRRLVHLGWAPLLETSATQGQGVEKIFDVLDPILEARMIRVPTPILNAVIADLQGRTPIPGGLRVKYAVQAEVAPPTVVLFGTPRVPDQWLRYLEKGLRRKFGFDGTPIHFVLRGQERRKRSRAG